MAGRCWYMPAFPDHATHWVCASSVGWRGTRNKPSATAQSTRRQGLRDERWPDDRRAGSLDDGKVITLRQWGIPLSGRAGPSVTVAGCSRNAGSSAASCSVAALQALVKLSLGAIGRGCPQGVLPRQYSAETVEVCFQCGQLGPCQKGCQGLSRRTGNPRQDSWDLHCFQVCREGI